MGMFNKGVLYRQAISRQRYKTIKLMEENYEKNLARLYDLKERGEDISPVFIDTVEAFKQNMKANFKAQLTPDEPPLGWKRLSSKYAKRKFKEVGNRKANLILTGRLRDAVYGGLGWFQKILKTKAQFGIKGIDYASVHQYGSIKKNIPARRYFVTKEGNLPRSVVNYMTLRIEKYITQGV